MSRHPLAPDDSVPAPRRPRARSAAAQPAETIDDPRARTLDLPAGDGGETRRLFIGLPAVPAPAAGYSVLCALDGNAFFPMLWRAREQLAPQAPVLLVAAGYPTPMRFDVERRCRDYTPPTARESMRRHNAHGRTGERLRLLEFLARDARRAVADLAPVDELQHTLFGHSLGALFVLHALFCRTGLYSSYVAADPSLHWNNASILHEERAFRAGVAAAGGRLAFPKRLLLVKSGNPHDAHTHEEVQQHTRRLRNLARRMASTGGLDVHLRVFAHESHPSVMEPAARLALRFHLRSAGDDAPPIHPATPDAAAP